MDIFRHSFLDFMLVQTACVPYVNYIYRCVSYVPLISEPGTREGPYGYHRDIFHCPVSMYIIIIGKRNMYLYIREGKRRA